MTLLGVLFILPAGLSLALNISNDRTPNWWQAYKGSSRQAPAPETTEEAVLQVYVARAYGWRGSLGVHSWIALKPSTAGRYIRLEVLGWSVRRGGKAVRISAGNADAYWYGNHPHKLVDLRGTGVDELIQRVMVAAKTYPYDSHYRLWPGPNSNTFIAWIGRKVPELGMKLPVTAIGKDYIASGGVFAQAPSGSGYQLSFFGLGGLLFAFDEGIEINLLGLTAGIDILNPAIKLPGIGRIDFPTD